MSLDNPQRSPVELLTPERIQLLLKQAERLPRGRINENFHIHPEDNLHRFLNVLTHDTYVAPHRHPRKAESTLVLEGRIGLLIFNDGGAVTSQYVVGRELGFNEPFGMDLLPGVWHTLVVLGQYAALYEVKPGPYIQETDKEFAPWALREGDAKTAAYLQELRSHFV